MTSAGSSANSSTAARGTISSANSIVESISASAPGRIAARYSFERSTTRPSPTREVLSSAASSSAYGLAAVRSGAR